MSSASQLYLLADHVKLSLLERQRAISLDLEPNAQNGNISRSLESMREGVESIESEAARLQEKGDSNAASLRSEASALRTQYNDLDSRFRGFPTTNTDVTSPNDPSLASDFVHATSQPQSSIKRGTNSPAPKNVRFRDNPASENDAEEEAARNALFPYHDEPDLGSGSADQSKLDNVQIHQYHDQVLREQDDQLDRLGESIGRQRDLSMRIGEELDEHVEMLDDLDTHVDRQQGRLDNARKRVGKIARKANENKSLTIIAILIVVLVLLIIITKR